MMPITARDYENILKRMDDNHKAIMDTLNLRKQYWDERIGQICNVVNEMKHHCEQQEVQCGKVFEWYDKRIKEDERQIAKNTTAISNIKTIGSVAVLIWGAIVALIGHIIKKI